jgi:hypothetical protein
MEQQAYVKFLPERWTGMSYRAEVLFFTDNPLEPQVRIPVLVEAG